MVALYITLVKIYTVKISGSFQPNLGCLSCTLDLKWCHFVIMLYTFLMAIVLYIVGHGWNTMFFGMPSGEYSLRVYSPGIYRNPCWCREFCCAKPIDNHPLDNTEKTMSFKQKVRDSSCSYRNDQHCVNHVMWSQLRVGWKINSFYYLSITCVQCWPYMPTHGSFLCFSRRLAILVAAMETINTLQTIYFHS